MKRHIRMGPESLRYAGRITFLLAASTLWATSAYGVEQFPLPSRMPIVILWGMLGVVGLVAARTALIGAKTRNPKKTRVAEISLLTLGVCFPLLLAETYCAFALCRSEGIGISFAAQRWRARYWRPINSDGFRDIELPSNSPAGKGLVLVLGDSFAAADGVRDYRDSFPRVLGEQLGDDFLVINRSMCGMESPHQLQAARGFPFSPDIVILSYCPYNDIWEDARSSGHAFNLELLLPRGRVWSWLTRNSYLCNFLHFSLQLHYEGDNSLRLLNFLNESYDSAEILHRHRQTLQGFVDYAEENEAKLLVVVWPIWGHPELTTKIFETVASAFGKEVSTINLEKAFEGWPLKDKIVNMSNLHPSVDAHRAVATLLADEVKQKARR